MSLDDNQKEEQILDSNLGHKPPLITVLMVVRNEEEFISEAIQSILDQTFKDFELMIIDDNSTDGTRSIVRTFTDPRIQFHSNPNKPGKSGGLNFGFSIASGKYLALMDGDDISLPKRLELQLQFMEANREVGACGTGLVKFYMNRWFVKERNVIQPANHENIMKKMFYGRIGLNNATTMFRVSVIPEGIKYNDQFICSEDYLFFSELSEFLRYANLPDISYRYRRHQSNLTRLSKAHLIRDAKRAHLIHLCKYFSEFDFPNKSKIMNILMKGSGKISLNELKEAMSILIAMNKIPKKGMKVFIKLTVNCINYDINNPADLSLTLVWLKYKILSVFKNKTIYT